MPRVRGAWGTEPGPGVLRALRAVPEVRGGGYDRRETLPYVRGERQAAPGEAGHGQDTRRGEGRHEDPGSGQGQRWHEGWSGGGPVRGDAGSGASGLQAARGRLRRRGAGQLRRGGARGGARGTPEVGRDGQAAAAGGNPGG